MPTECLEGYVHMLEILVTKYGILENFYSDENTILICPKNKENLTDFGYMCEDLGINIIAANKYILNHQYYDYLFYNSLIYYIILYH